jgi:hypothetical protein
MGMTKKAKILAVAGGASLVVMLGMVAGIFDIFEGDDFVDLDSNRGADRAVVLVYGKKNGRCLESGVFRGKDLVNLGNMSRKGTCRSEVAVFSLKDSFHLEEGVQVWTDEGGDKVPIQLRALAGLKLTMWVLREHFAPTAKIVAADLRRANSIFDTNSRCGIQFDAGGEVHDISGKVTEAMRHIRCPGVETLKERGWYRNNTLNIYYIENNGLQGKWCAGSSSVLISITADGETLAHELGHAFALEHTDGILPGSNLMATGSNRNEATEGQCYRANLESNSRIHMVRTNPVRNCPIYDKSDKCPAVDLEE